MRKTYKILFFFSNLEAIEITFHYLKFIINIIIIKIKILFYSSYYMQIKFEFIKNGKTQPMHCID